MAQEKLILASGSSIRRQLLQSAGVNFDIARPPVDEAALKEGPQLRGASATRLAMALAEAKALSVSSARAGLVIGADQVLAAGGETFDKAESLAEAAERLKALSGVWHELIGGLVLARGPDIVWRRESRVRLKIRPLSEAFIRHYLSAVGEDVLKSVGCYQFEGLGVQLFEKVEGDFFAVLGLDLVPLLAALRAEGALAS